MDDAAVTELGIIVGTRVYEERLEITVGPAAGVDVGVATGETRLEDEVGVVEDAVVGGGSGVDLLDVEMLGAGGVLGG